MTKKAEEKDAVEVNPVEEAVTTQELVTHETINKVLRAIKVGKDGQVIDISGGNPVANSVIASFIVGEVEHKTGYRAADDMENYVGIGAGEDVFKVYLCNRGEEKPDNGVFVAKTTRAKLLERVLLAREFVVISEVYASLAPMQVKLVRTFPKGRQRGTNKAAFSV